MITDILDQEKGEGAMWNAMQGPVLGFGDSWAAFQFKNLFYDYGTVGISSYAATRGYKHEISDSPSGLSANSIVQCNDKNGNVKISCISGYQ